jgi:hypothetical protein
MRLCIEYVGPGPRDQALLSIAHYFEQNSDLMKDPEVLVEVTDGDGWDDTSTWGPVSFEQSLPPYRSEAVAVRDGQVLIYPRWVQDLRSFMRIWNKNLGEQGYVEAFKAQKGGGDDSR